MNLPESVLALLICPETRFPLRIGTVEECQSLQRRHAESSDVWDEALVCDEGGRAYPVRDDFPILLREASVSFDSPP